MRDENDKRGCRINELRQPLWYLTFLIKWLGGLYIISIFRLAWVEKHKDNG